MGIIALPLYPPIMARSSDAYRSDIYRSTPVPFRIRKVSTCASNGGQASV